MSEDWDDAGSPGQQSELAREWDLRREQHYNVTHRALATWTAAALHDQSD